MPRTVIALDTETELITTGCLAPRLVCVSWAREVNGSLNSGLLKAGKDVDRNVGGWIKGAAQTDAFLLVGHNVAYDMAVLAAYDPALLPFIFQAYERGNIADTQIREQLLDIAKGDFWKIRKLKGGYALAGISERRLGIKLNKGADSWRLRYGELIDTELHDWPDAAITYAVEDARSTYRIHKEQQGVANCEEQARAHFALHLMSCWGVITDAAKVPAFVKEAEDSLEALGERLSRTGLMRTNGTKNIKTIRERVKKSLGTKTKLTAKGNVVANEDALLATGDPELAMLVDYSKSQKLDSVWSRYLKQGADPATPVQATFHCLVESGRTSCSKPNLQNLHRATGLRECFIPRQGYLYVACDYATLELCTLAQVLLSWFGDSAMAEALKRGEDLHLKLAAQLMGISYCDALEKLKAGDKETKKMRQTSKAASFGFPGGLGAESFVAFAKGYGADITVRQAARLREDWFKTWPEMKQYFRSINNLLETSGGVVSQFATSRVRGGLTFTQACNTFFQGLAADGGKAALFEVSKRCYTDPTSALYGSKPVMFVHDEIIIESSIEKAAAAAEELSSVMVEEMERFTPDIPIKTSLALMRRWYKDAEEVRDSTTGKLVPWEPPVNAAKRLNA